LVKEKRVKAKLEVGEARKAKRAVRKKMKKKRKKNNPLQENLLPRDVGLQEKNKKKTKSHSRHLREPLRRDPLDLNKKNLQVRNGARLPEDLHAQMTKRIVDHEESGLQEDPLGMKKRKKKMRKNPEDEVVLLRRIILSIMELHHHHLLQVLLDLDQVGEDPE
jgi:hypothetical protein